MGQNSSVHKEPTIDVDDSSATSCTGGRTVFFGGRSIKVEAPPWDEGTTSGNSFTLEPSIEAQFYACHGNLTLFIRGQDRCRFAVWALIKMAMTGAVPTSDLFASNRKGHVYTHRPDPPSSIPFQIVHVGAQAIPNALADTPCAAMGVQGLLRQLNDVLGANLMLGHPGLRQCLEYFVKSSMDFGEAYGYLRTMDRTDFERVLQRLADQQQTDEGLRKKAVQGSYIDNADVEPRRVWDVLSNRVLPFYVIPKNSKRRFPQNVWTISHSWVPPEVRQLVWTPVNGNRWPVPIPQATTLDHARVELLNFGVEYSWLDVLCLRQRGRPEDEAMRTEEWKLDVPTIGRVYQLDWPCVTYFNGLGLPFDPSPQTLSSAQHWLRRVWTLQETTSSWLPGGATGDASDAARAFFHEHLPRDAPTLEYGRWDKAVAALQVRHCTTELDRVHALAYVFSCHTLPIYDEGMTPPLAWAVLLKHMSPGMRGSVAELYVQRFPERTALLPSWEELLQCPPGSDMVPLWNPWVDLVDPSCRSSSDPAVYSQKTKHVGILSMSQQGDDETYSPIFEPSDHLRSTLSDRLSPSRYQILGRYQPNTKYSVIDFSGGLCLVVEIVGKRTIGGQSWLEVVKRGCLQFAAPLAWEIFKNFDNISVVHATVDD